MPEAGRLDLLDNRRCRPLPCAVAAYVGFGNHWIFCDTTRRTDDIMIADALFSLKGKTALVTGASYGLGVTFAETLAGAGADLVLAARSLDKLQALADRLGAGGQKTLAVKCDVGNAEDVALDGRDGVGPLRSR